MDKTWTWCSLKWPLVREKNITSTNACLLLAVSDTQLYCYFIHVVSLKVNLAMLTTLSIGPVFMTVTRLIATKSHSIYTFIYILLGFCSKQSIPVYVEVDIRLGNSKLPTKPTEQIIDSSSSIEYRRSLECWSWFRVRFPQKMIIRGYSFVNRVIKCFFVN